MDTLPTPRAVTRGPLYHWFGYYDMPCWDASGRYLLSLGVPFEERPPTADDVAEIGLTDLHHGAYTPLAATRAFNWQQGAMLHWLPTAPERQIIYNDRREGRFVAVVRDVCSGAERVLPRATSDVGLRGGLALSINFARLAVTRPGYGYAGLPDPFHDDLHPAGDGVYALDLASGDYRLLVSIQDVLDLLGSPAEMAQAKMWFNHTLLNPSETRLVWLTRWRPAGAAMWKTLMCSARADGSELRVLLGGGPLAPSTGWPMVSHFDWRNDKEVLAWTRIGDEGDHFYLINVVTGAYAIVGARDLTQDGHCSYAHNGRWIITDTYPDRETQRRTLKVYLPAEEREVVVGRLLSPPPFVGELRCDLHPRWSRDDRHICFDSVHEGHRQIYILDTPPLP